MLSVRSRIVGVVAALSLVGMITAGLTAYFIDRQRQLEQIDHNLSSAYEAVEFIVSGEGRQWHSAEEALEAAVAHPSIDDNTGILGIVDGRPSLVPGIAMDLELQSLDGFVDRVVAEGQSGRTVVGTFSGDDGAVRYLVVPITVTDSAGGVSGPVIYVIGYDLNRELSELDFAATVFVISALVVTAIIVIVGLLVSGRLLRPIREMSSMAKRISASNLSERIPVTGNDDVSQMAGTVNEMLDRLDAGLDAQRQLMQDVGHELNTPLTIVRGHLELMDEHDPTDVAHTRELAVDELDRMAGLVDDIRSTAQLSDPKEYRFETVWIADLLERIRAKSEAIPGAELDEPQEAPAVAVMADSNRLTQAVVQLVANAVKHAGGRITLGARPGAPGHIEVFVRDRGPGVPDAQKAAIFERFHRGDGTRSSGSGLGLAIVAAIAQRHGGVAWVRDALPGAEFVLSLPIAAVQQQAVRHEEAQWHRS